MTARCPCRRRNGAATLRAAAVSLLLAALACKRPPPPPIVVLGAGGPPAPSPAPSNSAAGPAELVLAQEWRAVWPGGSGWQLATGGEPGRLLLGAGAAGGTPALAIDLVEGGRRRPLLRQPLAAGRWHDRAVEVPAAAAGAVLAGRLAGCGRAPCGWSATAFVPQKGRRQAAGPVNVLMILTDTLRADALGSYRGGGAAGGNTPTLDALAASGTRFAQARAAAAWTLPSVATLFTSRWSGEIRDWAKLPQHLPPTHRTLAEAFAGAGYATAGFSAHPLIAHDTGYGRGFATLWAPSEDDMAEYDALAVSARAAAWLRVHQQRPFFTYVHFLDPHAPYCPADCLPADPKAPMPGNAIAVALGEQALPDAAELAEWRRLYAAEVAVVDRGVARLLAALDPETRARTLVAFVADHGEEFLDHGFVGHVWSLYDELLHVPFLLAGPGIPARRVVEEPVGLVDVLPTVTALAGIPVAEPDRAAWRGVDLTGLLAGRTVGPRTLIAQTGTLGYLRIAVQRGRLKAILFNGGGVGGELVTDADKVALARLPPEALFDLRADPRERQNLAGRSATEGFLPGARDLVLDHLGEHVEGRWTALRGPGRGGLIEGTVRYSRPLAQVVPMFLLAGEQVTAEGDRLHLRLHDDGRPRAWLVPDVDVKILEARIAAGGAPFTARPWRGTRALSPASWAEWRRSGPDLPREGSEENLRRLRALGYIR